MDLSDPETTPRLVEAHSRRERPLCLCRQPPIEMYIAKRGDKYLMKRMPNTGADHDPACESYEPPAELSGLGEVLGSAIQENVEDVTTVLKLAFSLTRLPGRATAKVGPPTDSVKTDGTKLTLRGTLHYLYEQAGLNKWTPAMSGKRNWYVNVIHEFGQAVHSQPRMKMESGKMGKLVSEEIGFVLDRSRPL